MFRCMLPNECSNIVQWRCHWPDCWSCRGTDWSDKTVSSVTYTIRSIRCSLYSLFSDLKFRLDKPTLTDGRPVGWCNRNWTIVQRIISFKRLVFSLKFSLDFISIILSIMPGSWQSKHRHGDAIRRLWLLTCVGMKRRWRSAKLWRIQKDTLSSDRNVHLSCWHRGRRHQHNASARSPRTRRYLVHNTNMWWLMM